MTFRHKVLAWIYSARELWRQERNTRFVLQTASTSSALAIPGTIPGAINIPYTYIVDELVQLGCEPDFDGSDCQAAKPVALFCNGVWCGQSPTAIRNMIKAGYPADRIFYYRGGMQVWRLLGLSVVGGK